LKGEVAENPREMVRDIVSKYISEKPSRITLRLFWGEDRSIITVNGDWLNAPGRCPSPPFAYGVVDTYREAYGEIKVIPVSFREEIYENDRVSLLLCPTGSAGIFGIYVKCLGVRMLRYGGFFKAANEKPRGAGGIEIFARDWNKDWFAFYAYISLENYERDIEEINMLIRELNWTDGDVYVELINHSPCLKDFYRWLYEKGYFTHHCALNPENWRG